MANGVNTKLATALSDLSTMIAELSSIAGDSSTETSLFQENIGGTTGGPAVKMAIALYDLYNLLTNFEGGSIMALLEQIATCACQALTGRVPLPTDTGGCSSPVASLADHGFDSGASGRDVILWAKPVPNGFSAGSILNGSTTAGEIIASSRVSAASIYVQSAKAGTFSINPNLGAFHPCNVWFALGNITDLEVNVPAGADGKAFLCYTVSDHYTCATVPVVYSGAFSGTYHHLTCALGDISGPFTNASNPNTGGADTVFTPAAVYDGSVINWHFQCTQPWTFYHRSTAHNATSGPGYTGLDVAANVNQLITSDDGSWFIRLQSGATPEGTFTITPPA